MSIPGELARREARLAKLAEAHAKIEARAKERFEQEMAEYHAKLAAREEKAAATGKKPGGRPPAPPVEGPQPKDQINLTDEDSRIMPVAGGGFEQCYNAQAVVATESLLVIATDVVQTPNDKQQIAPMLEKIDALPERFGQVETLLADNGYFSEANVMVCVAANIEPLIASEDNLEGGTPARQIGRQTTPAQETAPEAFQLTAYRDETRLGSGQEAKSGSQRLSVLTTDRREHARCKCHEIFQRKAPGNVLARSGAGVALAPESVGVFAA
jgi:hypothetical protein